MSTELVAILTFSQTVGMWTNVLMVLAVSYPGVLIADRVRRVLYQAGLDTIAVYTAWKQANVDEQRRQLEIGAARLALAEKRRLLLDKFDEVSR